MQNGVERTKRTAVTVEQRTRRPPRDEHNQFEEMNDKIIITYEDEEEDEDTGIQNSRTSTSTGQTNARQAHKTVDDDGNI